MKSMAHLRLVPVRELYGVCQTDYKYHRVTTPRRAHKCQYPFWVGGSQVVFAGNNWGCTKSPESPSKATASTPQLTKVDNR